MLSAPAAQPALPRHGRTSAAQAENHDCWLLERSGHNQRRVIRLFDDSDGHDQFVCQLASGGIQKIQRAIGDFHKDLEEIRIEKESEANSQLRSGVTAYKLLPADFSPMK